MRGDLFWRAMGLALIGIGAALAWFFALKPLAEARAGTVAEVSYSIKLFVLAPMVLVLGLFMLLGGERIAPLVTGPPRTRGQHLVVWPLLIVAAGAGLAGFLWFDGELRALGFLRRG